MPAESGSVVVGVVATSWVSVDQIVFVKAGGSIGYFQVTAKTSTTLTLLNLKVTATGVYAANVAPTTAFASGAVVTHAGLQGVTGSAGAAATVEFGNGSPEAAVTATTGKFYFKQDAPIALWLKTSGSGNTGWTELLSA